MADSHPVAHEPAGTAAPEHATKQPRSPLSDANAGRISVVVHALLAIGAGWLAPQFHSDLIGGVVGLILLAAVGYPLTIVLGRKGFKWWAVNGLIIYLFFFLVSWAWMLNA